MDRAFDAIGSSRRIAVEVADLRAVPGYVREGLGVAVVPDWDLTTEPDLIVTPLAEPSLTWPLNLVTASGKPLTRALQALLELVNDASPAS